MHARDLIPDWSGELTLKPQTRPPNENFTQTQRRFTIVATHTSNLTIVSDVSTVPLATVPPPLPTTSISQ
eukprot:1353154-Amphidinium_carterae.1